MTFGPAIAYTPVCPEHHVGGPVGYVRANTVDRCPVIARREPVLYEAFERVRAAADQLIQARREI